MEGGVGRLVSVLSGAAEGEGFAHTFAEVMERQLTLPHRVPYRVPHIYVRYNV